MTGSTLMALNMTARVLFTQDFLSGEVTPAFDDHVVDAGLDREVDLTALDALIEQVVHTETFHESTESSDAWLAPRIHATLRLRRAEAADRRLWSWLAVVRYPDYVRWRFPGRGGVTTVKRFLGGDRDNALSRLWWGAEMTRDGGDYRPTVRAFERQDIPNTWFALDAFHNKAAALAAMRMLPGLGGRPINQLSTALNHYLTTIMLDTAAPSSGPDQAAIEEWIATTPEMESLVGDELPHGPDEDPVDPGQIGAIEALVRRVAGEVGISLAPENSSPDPASSTNEDGLSRA